MMKNANERYSEIDVSLLDKEVADIVSAFNGLQPNGRFAPPSARIIETIHSEASRHILRRKFERKVRRFVRFAAAAAIIVLVVAGGFHLNTLQENNRREEVLNQLCIVSSEDGTLPVDTTETTTAALAEMLMEMQGLDEETYFAVN